MDISAYIVISIIYLSAMVLTVYMLKEDYFGYAAFAGPFLTYPVATIIAIITISAMGVDFDFVGSIYYILGGFAAYSVLSLLITMATMPRVSVHNIKVKGVKTDATELPVYDEHARPTGEMISVSAIQEGLSQMTFIQGYGRYHIAYAPDQFDAPYFYPRGIFIDPNHIEFKGSKKLQGKRFHQNKKPADIKEIEVDVTGLKKGVEEVTLLTQSGEKSGETIDREDFYEYTPIMSKVTLVNGKAIVKMPVDGSWKKAMRLAPDLLLFNSSADEERIEKFRNYRPEQVSI